jgi:hypothetical protein
MLELYVAKATRTVPRRERGSNPSDLADKAARTDSVRGLYCEV